MKKNILYIFICIITMVLFFGVAATCNLCGIPVEIGEAEDTSNEDEEEDADAVQDSGDDTQGNDNGGQEGSQGNDNGGQDGSQGNNNDDSQGDDNGGQEESQGNNNDDSREDDNDGQDGSQEDNGDDPQVVWEEMGTLVYDFMEGASGAYWYTNYGDISFGGELNDDRGFARFRNNIILEDGETYSRVLETHPAWIDNGLIFGRFPNTSDKIQIPAGARFTAKVGFIDGLTLTDGVNFRIRFNDGSNDYYFPGSAGIHCEYDGALNTLDFDLSSIAGKSGFIDLLVRAGATSAQDWAVWVDPKIIK